MPLSYDVVPIALLVEKTEIGAYHRFRYDTFNEREYGRLPRPCRGWLKKRLWNGFRIQGDRYPDQVWKNLVVTETRYMPAAMSRRWRISGWSRIASPHDCLHEDVRGPPD